MDKLTHELNKAKEVSYVQNNRFIEMQRQLKDAIDNGNKLQKQNSLLSEQLSKLKNMSVKIKLIVGK